MYGYILLYNFFIFKNNEKLMKPSVSRFTILFISSFYVSLVVWEIFELEKMAPKSSKAEPPATFSSTVFFICKNNKKVITAKFYTVPNSKIWL